MKNLSFLFIAIVIFITSCKNNSEIIIMSYNVENLFDTIDDPKINDDEFLPNSDKNWTEERYNKKLKDIARVIKEIGNGSYPAIVGLQEVENRKVLEDLVATKEIKKANFNIAHFDSPDNRGIDVALLYNPKILKSTKYEIINVDIGFNTRDILHVSGKIEGEIFHFYVNHWPSRIGGIKETEEHRLAVAKALKLSIDKVLAQNSEANIVIMGDMNDEPSNNSIHKILDAGSFNSNSEFVNLLLARHKNGEGTYNHRGNWNMLDNLIISRSLFDNKGLDATNKDAHIFHNQWMEYKSGNKKVPNKTYGSSDYFGGVSDHFPIYFKIQQVN